MANIVLPIKPHLRKYIIKKLKIQDNTLRVSTTDKMGFGLFIIETLGSKTDFFFENKNVDEIRFIRNIPENSIINLQLGPYIEDHCGRFLPENKIYSINKHLDKFFLNEMFTFINSLLLHDPNIVALYALDDFLSIYNITDDDIQIQSVYKTFRRHKDKYSYII